MHTDFQTYQREVFLSDSSPRFLTAKPITRRNLLAATGTLAAGGVFAGRLGAPFIANAAAAEPIKVGMLFAKTGQSFARAEYLAQGSILALEARNSLIKDRPVELIWLDDPNPQAAQQNAERLIGEHKVVAIAGAALSSSALAISAVAKRAKIPYVASNAAVGDLTGKLCNRYTFRVQSPVAVHSAALAPYCIDVGKKWYLITSAFAYGQDVNRTFVGYAERNGCTVVGNDEVPLGTADYSSFILKIRAAKPDIVVGGLSGGDFSTFLKQWNELGMRGRIPFAEISIGHTDIWGVGPEVDGLYTTNWDVNDPDNTPEEKAMVEAFKTKFDKPACNEGWLGWIAMKSLLDSIEAAPSTEPAAIVESLENWSFQRGARRIHYRNFDHQMTNKLLIVGVKPTITDKYDWLDIKVELPKDPADVDKLYGSQAESACKMDSL